MRETNPNTSLHPTAGKRTLATDADARDLRLEGRMPAQGMGRRGLLVAAVVLASPPGDVRPAEDASGTDDALIVLCADLLAGQDARDSDPEAAEALRPGPERDAAWTVIYEGTARYHAALAAICATPACTLAGLAAKARVTQAHIFEEPRPGSDDLPGWSLAADVLRLTGGAA